MKHGERCEVHSEIRLIILSKVHQERSSEVIIFEIRKYMFLMTRIEAIVSLS